MTRPTRFKSGGLLVVGAIVGGVLTSAWQSFRQISPLVSPVYAQPAQPPTPPAPWLKGTADEKFAQIEKHLRGLDVAMAEIGYRYGELLHAGKTRNWEHAQYQAEKIELALKLAVERRPKRAQSAKPFLELDLPRVINAAKGKDPKLLDSALESLHNGCVQCHTAEKVEFFKDSVERIKERTK